MFISVSFNYLVKKNFFFGYSPRGWSHTARGVVSWASNTRARALTLLPVAIKADYLSAEQGEPKKKKKRSQCRAMYAVSLTWYFSPQTWTCTHTHTSKFTRFNYYQYVFMNIIMVKLSTLKIQKNPKKNKIKKRPNSNPFFNKNYSVSC